MTPGPCPVKRWVYIVMMTCRPKHSYRMPDVNDLEGKSFFNHIRRSVLTSYCVASIIPLALLVYISVHYVYPSVSSGDIAKVPLNLTVLPLLALLLSVLGLILTRKATNTSISSAQNLNSKLTSLFDITRQFRETLYPDVLLKKILESAMALTGGEYGFILLRNEEGELQFTVTAGTGPDAIKCKVLESEECTASLVAGNGKPVLLNDASAVPRYDARLDEELGVKTASLLCVPLMYDNAIIGVIELRSKKPGAFTQQDESLLYSLADQAGMSIAQSRSTEQQHSDFIQITEILVGAQDSIQEKRGHARRVAHYAHLIGKKLSFTETELKNLYHASLLHDIGKLRLDTRDLHNAEQLIQHPKLGHDLIKSISQWSDTAEIILHHHERYDGAGYPDSRKQNEIPLGARIIAVADAFDILTNEYSTRNQLDPETALKEIESHSGTCFDPDAVKALKSSISDADVSGEF
jgi:HD-GYP domain-containing protein (c-di-GMP phosphodiesterase class II)